MRSLREVLLALRRMLIVPGLRPVAFILAADMISSSTRRGNLSAPQRRRTGGIVYSFAFLDIAAAGAGLLSIDCLLGKARPCPT
jgi:hypothetical protein